MDKQIAQQFNEIAKKRQVLEHLQAFIKQLHIMMSSMEPVQQILKPSQKATRSSQQILDQLMGPFEDRPNQQLQKSLATLDHEVGVSLEFILKVAESNVTEFTGKVSSMPKNDFVSAHHLLVEKMKDFRRKAQTDVAVRLTLQKRGIIENAGKLPISQDALHERLDSIRNQEMDCKRLIIEKAREIIKDINLISDTDQCPNELKSELTQFKRQIKENLNRLKEGKEIEAMPTIFEEMSFEGSQSPATSSHPVEETSQEAEAPTPLPTPTVTTIEATEIPEEKNPSSDEDSPADNATPSAIKSTENASNAQTATSEADSSGSTQKPKKRKRMGIIQRTIKWLSSPWNVTWKDLKDE